MEFCRLARAALCGALLTGPGLGAQAAGATAGNELLGLWGAEPVLGPQVRGGLWLERQEGRWTMRVGGFEASAAQQGDNASIALPGGQGTLRLWTAGEVPEAYWIQPAGLGPSFAVPVPLRAAGPQAWRGVVAPIDAGFPLYLMVNREADGALRGTFRNPSHNWPGRAPFFGVALDDDTVTFTHPKTGKVQWRQPFDPAQRTITFDFGGPIVLSPRTPEQAVGYVPRSPALPPYRYRAPLDLGDGWKVGGAAQATMDPGALQAIVRDLAQADPLIPSTLRVDSLLVAHGGRLVLEEYFRGQAADVPHDLRSASKTMTSIMVGAAIQHGASLSSRSTLPGAPITLGHLLSHSSGLACDDDDGDSPGNEDTMQAQSAQPDWYAYFKALPKLREPGQAYVYCSAGINMVGQMLGSATGLWLPRLFEKHLARPLQFSRYGINLMPTGEAYSGGGMHLLPRDFLKFGQLYLDGGRWQGRQLVSPAWIHESTAHRIDRPDGSDDGLGWHRHRMALGSRTVQAFEASGNGGQFLFVVPELKLAVVVTAGQYGDPGWSRIRQELIPAVLRAVR